MSIQEVGAGLVALCQEGKFMEALDKYYGDDIVSIEGASMPGMEQRMEGIDAVRGKGEWWVANHEVHEMKVEGPFCIEGEDRFAVHFYMDVTSKMDGKRNKMSEVALYTVKDDKISEERFFYGAES